MSTVSPRVRSLAALAAVWIATAAVAGDKATPEEAGINGIWRLATPAFKELKDADGKAPPLNAEGQKLYDERHAMLRKGDSSFDLAQKCKPMGFPRVLWDGSPFDMQVVTGQQVFQGYSFNRNHRIIVEWQKQLPELQIPRYYGTSAAYWDGKTLVVLSALYNGSSLLDASGLPLSDDLAIVERYTPSADGKRLQVRLTLTDSKYYTRPWDVSVNFERVANGRIAEDVCEERAPYYLEVMKKLGMENKQ